MGLDKILVANATRNTAREGATESYSYYWGKKALLLHVAPFPGRMTATAIATFAWTGHTGSGGVEGIGTGVKTRKFHIDAIDADRVEAEMAFDMKVVAPDLGIYLTSVVS
jgi:hypothetical protein